MIVIVIYLVADCGSYIDERVVRHYIFYSLVHTIDLTIQWTSLSKTLYPININSFKFQYRTIHFNCSIIVMLLTRINDCRKQFKGFCASQTSFVSWQRSNINRWSCDLQRLTYRSWTIIMSIRRASCKITMQQALSLEDVSGLLVTNCSGLIYDWTTQTGPLARREFLVELRVGWTS